MSGNRPMNPQINISQSAIRDFCRAHSVRELAVFGSAVREDFNLENDIYVLIDIDPGARVGLRVLQRMCASWRGYSAVLSTC